MAYQKTHCVLLYLFFLYSKKGEDNMRKFIVGRVLSIIPVLIIVSVVIFSVVHLTPGDPAASILGDEATVEDIAALRAKMGLDKPVVEQYFVWIGNISQFFTWTFSYDGICREVKMASGFRIQNNVRRFYPTYPLPDPSGSSLRIHAFRTFNENDKGVDVRSVKQ